MMWVVEWLDYMMWVLELCGWFEHQPTPEGQIQGGVKCLVSIVVATCDTYRCSAGRFVDIGLQFLWWYQCLSWHINKGKIVVVENKVRA